jgi:threonylcarbamoyladenosine tRNA methylthiotransferase MtaB
LGKTVEILVEEQRTSVSGLLKGLTSNYVPVLIDAADNLQNSFATVTIETLRDASVFGTLATGIRKKD